MPDRILPPLNPWRQPTLDVPTAGAYLAGLGKASSYEAVHRGDLPVIRLGNRMRVSTARLMEILGLPIPPAPAQPDHLEAAADGAV